MKNLSKMFEKQKRKKYEEIEFHNLIQDWVFTTFTGCGCTEVLGKMPGD